MSFYLHLLGTRCSTPRNASSRQMRYLGRTVADDLCPTGPHGGPFSALQHEGQTDAALRIPNMVQLCELAVNVDLQMPEAIERRRHDLGLTRSRDLDLELVRAIVRHPSRGNTAHRLNSIPLRATTRRWTSSVS
jgi:hypothetical protein